MNLLHFDSVESWISGVTTYWRDRLSLTPALKHCLASGSTPVPVYREMVHAVQRGDASFAKAVVFALDEFGGLAPGDSGTCRKMLERDLVRDVDLPQASFHFLDAHALDLKAECRRYEELIGPGFDLVILGIGLNGHLGMNEPGSGLETGVRRCELHETTVASSARYLTHQRLPRWGLTVGIRQFLASKEVWLLATGQVKAEVVHHVVKGQITDQLPASLMRRHPNCSLFVDAAAGSLL